MVRQSLVKQHQNVDLENKIVLDNGELVEVPKDTVDLPEFDWDDPKNQTWIQKLDEQNIKKYGRLTTEQMESIYKIKCKLLVSHPKLDEKEAFDLAWEKTLQKKLPSGS